MCANLPQGPRLILVLEPTSTNTPVTTSLLWVCDGFLDIFDLADAWSFLGIELASSYF